MIKSIYCILFFCISLSVQAQDVIITKDGDALKVYDLEVSPTAVFYREASDDSSPIIRKSKEDLLMIKYQDGRKEIISDTVDELKVPVTQEQKTNNTITNEEYTLEDKEANAAVMQKWQERIPDYIGKSKQKQAVMLYCVLRPSAESIIADANVEMSLISNYKEDKNHKPEIHLAESNFVIIIKNKTRNTIFLDLGNSFFIRGEQSEPYYIPTANSSTSGTASGVGVNMGAVVGAMGIGGPVGKLADGINLSRTNSQYNTTTVYSQRIVSVPPMSSKNLDPKVFIPITREPFDVSQFWGTNIVMEKRNRYGDGIPYPHLQNYGSPISIGEVRDYKEGDLPIKIGLFITYSFTEDVLSPRTLHSSFDIRRIIGVPEYTSGITFGLPLPFASPNVFTPQQLKDASFFLWQNE